MRHHIGAQAAGDKIEGKSVIAAHLQVAGRWSFVGPCINSTEAKRASTDITTPSICGKKYKDDGAAESIGAPELVDCPTQCCRIE